MDNGFFSSLPALSPFFGLVPWPPPPIRRHAQGTVRGGLNLAIAAAGKRDRACDSCVSGLPQTSWPWRGATQGDRERGFLRTGIVHRTSGEDVEEDPFTLQGRAGVGINSATASPTHKFGQAHKRGAGKRPQAPKGGGGEWKGTKWGASAVKMSKNGGGGGGGEWKTGRREKSEFAPPYELPTCLSLSLSRLRGLQLI